MTVNFQNTKGSLICGVVLATPWPSSLHAAALMVDFGSGPVESGWQSYAATNADPDLAAVTYGSGVTGFTSSVTVDVDAVLDGSVLTTNIPANVFRVINRTPGATNGTAQPDLFHDWIAATQLPNQPETILRVTVADLPAGTYLWTSWHHDINDQTGLMDMKLMVDGVSITSQTIIDISNGSTVGINANNGAYTGVRIPTNTPTTFVQAFSVSAGQALVFEMSPQSPFNTALTSPSQFQSVNFAVMNAFQIEAIPEPSLGMLGLVAAGMMAGRRRRQS